MGNPTWQLETGTGTTTKDSVLGSRDDLGGSARKTYKLLGQRRWQGGLVECEERCEAAGRAVGMSLLLWCGQKAAAQSEGLWKLRRLGVIFLPRGGGMGLPAPQLRGGGDFPPVGICSTHGVTQI